MEAVRERERFEERIEARALGHSADIQLNVKGPRWLRRRGSARGGEGEQMRCDDDDDDDDEEEESRGGATSLISEFDE